MVSKIKLSHDFILTILILTHETGASFRLLCWLSSPNMRQNKVNSEYKKAFAQSLPMESQALVLQHSEEELFQHFLQFLGSGLLDLSMAGGLLIEPTHGCYYSLSQTSGIFIKQSAEIGTANRFSSILNEHPSTPNFSFDEGHIPILSWSYPKSCCLRSQSKWPGMSWASVVSIII